MLLQQLSDSLELRDIPKGILGDQKEAPGVKIQVKKIGRFFKSAKTLPVPSLAALFCFQQHTPLFQGEYERIVESGIPFIDAQGQQPPDGQP